MGKKSNIIEINGKKYDAHSGAAIDHVPATVKPAVKSITVHHHDAAAPAIQPAKPHHKAPAQRTAKKLPHHAPQRSTTLMRRSVKRPAADLKRHVRAQGHTDNLVERPAAEIVPKLSFGKPDSGRLQRATRVKKSRLIAHFNLGQPDYAVPVTVARSSRPRPAAASKPALALKGPRRQPAPDASDIFDRAIQQATSHLEPAPRIHKKRRLHLGRKHAGHARA